MFVYLDNSSTTPQFHDVTEEMVRVAEKSFGNPSSLHRMGVDAEKILRGARKTVAEFIGASDDEIIFTSGGTESDNTALFGAWEALKRQGKHVITASVEHHAILESCRILEQKGAEVTYIQPDRNGIIHADDVAAALRDDTIIVALMHVNNETGAVMPVEEVGRLLAGRKHTIFHCDAVQSYGKLPINVKKAGIDTLAASGHKIHGPKGTGILYINSEKRIVPYIYGGGQQHHMRSGTENMPGIAGFAKASSIMKDNLKENLRNVSQLRNMLLEGLTSRISDIKINSPLYLQDGQAVNKAESALGNNDDISYAPYDKCLPYILNVSFVGTRAEVILHMLEQEDIYVSTGSACSSNSKNKGSYVLRAMKLKDYEIEGAVRFSLSASNTAEQISYTIEKVAEAVEKNRRMLSLANKGRKRR